MNETGFRGHVGQLVPVPLDHAQREAGVAGAEPGARRARPASAPARAAARARLTRLPASTPPWQWNALKNGVARISCEVIASADLQNFVVQLAGQRMLGPMLEARFRADPSNHRTGRGEAGALDEAFCVLRNFNQVCKLAGKLEHRGAYEEMTRPSKLKFHVGQVLQHVTRGQCTVYGWELSDLRQCLCSDDEVPEKPREITDAHPWLSALAGHDQLMMPDVDDAAPNVPYYRVIFKDGLLSHVPESELAVAAPTAETLEPMRCTSFFFDQIAAQQDGDGVVKGVLYLPNPALAARYPEDAALLNDSLKTSTFTPVRIRKKQPCPSSQRALM